MRGLFILTLCLAVLGLVACSSGTSEEAAVDKAEETGNEVMQAAHDAGDAIKDESKDVKETAEDAAKEVKEAVKEKGDVNPILERSMKKDPGPESEVVVMKTSLGDITLRMFPKQAPITVANFKGLAAKGYYDGVIFHRIIANFMCQGGDPTGTGRGGVGLWGGPIVDEYSANLTFARPGILAMANKGRPTTGSSQFFITLAPTPHLNNKHTIFGEVIEGMDVVNKMAAVQKGPGDKPVEDIKILGISVEDRK